MKIDFQNINLILALVLHKLYQAKWKCKSGNNNYFVIKCSVVWFDDIHIYIHILGML